MCNQDASFTSSLMEAFTQQLGIKMIMVRPTNHKSLLGEHGIKNLWQQIEQELPKELMKFCHEVTENIMTYDHLVDFVVKCYIPLTWLERAKEDYLQNSWVVINKVFFMNGGTDVI